MSSTVSISLPKNAHKDTITLSEELLEIIPNSYLLEDEDYGDIKIDIVQDVGPQYLVLKSKEMQIVFKIIEYKSRARLRITSPITTDSPQLVVNNFTSEIGMKVVEFLALLFPIELESRQVVNFSVGGEFLFFRMYKFTFGAKAPIFEKVGPHITFRLWRIVEYNGEEKNAMKFENFQENTTFM